MSPRYAEHTEVSAERTRAEIEKTLDRYGADAFSYARDAEKAAIQFRMKGKLVRLMISLPTRNADEFRLTPSRGWERSEKDALAAWEQACRQRWRALSLVIKAKLETIDAQISSFEEEFLAFLVLPDNRTMGQYMIPQVHRAYETTEMPRMLPWAEDGPPALPEGS